MCDRTSPNYINPPDGNVKRGRFAILAAPASMNSAPSSNTPQPAQNPDVWVRLGGWLFKRRTSVPLPIIVALLALPPQSAAPWPQWLGGLLLVAGEAVRLWGVRQIG